MLRAIQTHLGSRQVSRVIYGAIVGLALIVALEAHPPSSAVVVATLLGSALAVALAELYSELLGVETRSRRHVHRAEVRHMASDAVAVAVGIAFPVVFFLLSAAHAIDEDSAFTIAEWSGVVLIGLYGFAASRLAGDALSGAVLRGVAAALIGAFLIALKAVALH